MGGDTKVWANGERVLSCMGEQCPATLASDIERLQGGRSRFRYGGDIHIYKYINI